MRVLMIEDDGTISYAVKTFLKRYEIETTVLENLKSAENIVFSDFDLIILDVNLPDGSGFDYLKWLRELSDIPVIMLTVKAEDEYVIKGFSEGADEYIAKPFSLPILKARIDNIFRRKDANIKELVFEDLHLDLISKTTRISDDSLELSRQEFALLELLLENININIMRERMIDSVWGYNFHEINDNTLSVTIKRLRSKLGSYGRHIKTVRGIGYTWDSE